MNHLYLYLLLFSFVIIVIYLIYYTVNVYYALKHKGEGQRVANSTDTPNDVTIIVPVYNEKVNLFEEAIERICKQGAKFIVVGDSSFEPYKSITEQNGGSFIYLEKRGGKRKALVEGIKHADTKFVMFVDSDTIIPLDTTKKLLAQFTDSVGGVGANVTVRKTNRSASYSAEFLERTRELILRAMSFKGGSVMVIDGKCGMYRTALVKPLITSPEFKDYKVAGRPTVVGDDQQLTAHIIKSGYKAAKCYDLVVETESPENFKQFTKQSIRWARSSYYYFLKNLTNGTAVKAGPFYVFEAVTTFILPVIALALSIFKLYFAFVFIGVHAGYSIDTLINFTMFLIGGSIHDHVGTKFMSVVGMIGPILFSSAIVNNLKKERLRTLAFGGIALLIAFFTSLYGLLTCWKQSEWLTR